MCLAVPGVVQEFTTIDGDERVAEVLFGGVLRSISLTCVPEAKVGDYVIAHAGVALQVIDEQEAAEILRDLKALEI